MAGLCAPLPTLRQHPYGCRRTARGRCGSLLLHRSGLAPPTPCRSPGALEWETTPDDEPRGCWAFRPWRTGCVLMALIEAGSARPVALGGERAPEPLRSG